MNQSAVTGWGTPQLSRILEEGEECSRRTDPPSRHQPHFHAQQEEEELDRIEKEISQIGKQLELLHYEMKQMQDKYSEEYLQKQASRNTLRKQLIDLDYAHKCIFARRHRSNNPNSIIHQFYNTKQTFFPSTVAQQPLKDRNEATSERANKFASPTKPVKQSKDQIELRTSERRVKGERMEAEIGEDLLRPRMQQLQIERGLLSGRLLLGYCQPYLHSYYSSYGSSYLDWWPY